MNASEVVQKARALNRMTTKEIVEAIFEDVVELHGDRRFGDDAAIVGGIARLGNQPITFIGTQKGHDVTENIQRNFGSPMPEGYRKAIRLMRQAEKFNRPVITFINTAGAYPDVSAEDRGIGEAIAESLLTMADLRVPILSIFIGEGGSGGALALAMGNQVWMMEFSMYAILSPEGFASILWKDAKRSKEAAELMKITPNNLLELGVVDRIIPEMKRKSPLKEETVLKNLRTSIEQVLKDWNEMSSEELVEQRQNRFRNF